LFDGLAVTPDVSVSEERRNISESDLAPPRGSPNFHQAINPASQKRKHNTNATTYAAYIIMSMVIQGRTADAWTGRSQVSMTTNIFPDQICFLHAGMWPELSLNLKSKPTIRLQTIAPFFDPTDL
jgi:hypothetical protein